MTGYHLYFMDRFSGHIEQRRDILADDEAKAVAIAQDWSNGQPMELWEGAHKLKRWDSEATEQSDRVRNGACRAPAAG